MFADSWKGVPFPPNHFEANVECAGPTPVNLSGNLLDNVSLSSVMSDGDDTNIVRVVSVLGMKFCSSDYLQLLRIWEEAPTVLIDCFYPTW